MEDIEIARNAKLKNITEIAEKLGIDQEYVEQYGKYKAKISNELIEKMKDKNDGKLILVTSINPTPLRRRKNNNFNRISRWIISNREKTNNCIKRTFFRTCIWNKRRSNRWWICTSCTNGRDKPSFYRRYTRNNICKQFTISIDRQPYFSRK